MLPELALSDVERVVVTVAAGNSHPLIDIDGTVFVQAVLFFTMFILGNKLLFQPYLRLREKRVAGIDGARAEAERMSAEADGKLADYESKLAAARAKAGEEQRKIRAEASKYEQEITEKSRKQAQATLDEAMARVTRETEAARAELAPKAEAIARQMAKQLLGREVA
ncbi:MAG TPA: ATP synthase F0 subunit B [Kofleriaceae bacterium]|jgi:F-type H+-transporting ATPase subunit b|nr:ATP synthase F0 subunit B [Kofleriaceae bacterium]